jgi:hypothetical protein
MQHRARAEEIMATGPITAVGIIALVEAIGLAEVVMIVGAIGLFAALHAAGRRRRAGEKTAQRPAVRMREPSLVERRLSELPELPELPEPAEPIRDEEPVLTGSIPTR